MVVDYQSLVWPPVAEFPPIRRSQLRSNSEVGQYHAVTMDAIAMKTMTTLKDRIKLKTSL